MKKTLFAVWIILICNYSFAQKPVSQIEINPYIRWDSYPKFSYSINSTSTNTVLINGTSWGVIAAYKFPINNKLSLRTGLGYYRHSFNKIENNNSSFGNSDARVINYEGVGDLIFRTNKYWYNTISVNLGVEKKLELKKNMKAVFGLGVSNYFTYSQYYRITHEYPTGPPNHRYLTKNCRYFGFSANVAAGITKQIGKISVGPSLIIPIYDQWKQDKIFPQEDNSKNRSKWINGIGIGIICNYSLKKNK